MQRDGGAANLAHASRYEACRVSEAVLSEGSMSPVRGAKSYRGRSRSAKELLISSMIPFIASQLAFRSFEGGPKDALGGYRAGDILDLDSLERLIFGLRDTEFLVRSSLCSWFLRSAIIRCLALRFLNLLSLLQSSGQPSFDLDT